MRFPSNIDSFTIESCAREARLGLVSSSAYYVTEAPSNEYLLPFVLWESKEMALKIENFARHLADYTGCR